MHGVGIALSVVLLAASTDARIIPRRFIVELASSADVPKFYRNARTAKSRPLDAHRVRTHVNVTSDIFVGTSFTLTDEDDEINTASLARVDGVLNVWPVETIALDPIETAPLATGDDALALGNWTSHATTGVDKLHAKGIFGKGVKVGVVDTGVWYDHPDLGGGYGKGFKVAGGYDFVGDANWPFEDASPDNDPKDQRGHGTHVSGIVAAKGPVVTGVAPEASLYVYKVFTTYESTSTDILIAAFLRAYEDGVDIITSSIGGTNGFPDNAWAVVASRLVEQGVFVSISAGNSGEIGPFYPSSGSSGTNVLAIASVQNQVLQANSANITTTTSDGKTSTVTVGYLPASGPYPVDVANYPIHALAFNTSDPAEACNPYPASTGDLSGYTVIVRRGTCTFAQKAQNLGALGAKYIIFYNNDGPLVNPSGVPTTIKASLVPTDIGVSILQALQQGSTVSIAVPADGGAAAIEDTFYGGTPSYFTSWGPLFDLTLKPDVAAPGGNILNTYVNNGYAVLSGTSMACPYVAGVAALWAGVHGGRARHGKAFGKLVASRIVTSGYQLPWTGRNGEKFPGVAASAAQVGNGMIDAGKVLNYKTSVDKYKISLNDTANFRGEHKIRITNSNVLLPVVYQFSVVEDGALLTATPANSSRPGTIHPFVEVAPIVGVKPRVTFFPPLLLVLPGQTRELTVRFAPPTGLDATRLPVYSGHIVISGSNGEEISLPYVGLAADLKKETNPLWIAADSVYPYSTSGQERETLQTKFSWSFDLAKQDYPSFFAAIKFGTKEWRLDVYEPGFTEAQWEYPPQVGKKGYVGAATTFNEVDHPVFVPGEDDPTDVSPFPLRNLYRNGGLAPTQREFWWFGSLANGSDIANGQYHLRFATLRPFGNPKLSADWTVWNNERLPAVVTVNRTSPALH
ncbi:subtilisin-like protein [Exidia glandulosa HHB12029]|uniref:Subtilisin-like protein n=1 Tax=Exidia glandulosa HHB12029 TaxID=1314781 RepID=A0A165NV81_EXIGL|nr:subtilisin-like protein [Exidia glandulosa HHB12029]